MVLLVLFLQYFPLLFHFHLSMMIASLIYFLHTTHLQPPDLSLFFILLPIQSIHTNFHPVQELCSIEFKHIQLDSTFIRIIHHTLFPMFSVAYIRQLREEGTSKSKWKDRSLKCIVVDTCNNSDGLLFYHPPSKQMLSCSDGYKFDTFTPAGPQFKETYNGRFIFNTIAGTKNIHRPPKDHLHTYNLMTENMFR
jgi:hypothetical protein